MANNAIEKVYCNEAQDEITIETAVELSAAMDYTPLSLFCRTKECRELGVKMEGVNHHKKKGTYERPPYFRTGKNQKHHDGCPYHRLKVLLIMK